MNNTKQIKLTLVFLLFSTIISSNVLAAEICQLLESDTDGDGWGWEAESSCRVTEQTGIIPELYHPRTGERLNIERLFWNWNDFSKLTFNECMGYVVDPNEPSDICSTCSEAGSTYQHFSNGTGNYNIQSRGQTNIAEFDWSVDFRGVYTGAMPIEVYGERTETGVRFWLGAEAGKVGFYTLCEVVPSSMDEPEASSSDDSTLECIDEDGDGFGWNGVATCIAE